MRRAVALLLVAWGLVGCTHTHSSPPGSVPTLTVLAAASLTDVFPKIGAAFSNAHPGVTVTFSFAGTDQLAAQIQQGAPADVFAGASPTYADQLARAHDIGPFRIFCTNKLVLVVPASNPAHITSPADLATKKVKLVMGSEAVPVGSYTRTVLDNLNSVYGAGYSDKVLANVVSNEDSVTSILAKVVSGEADAGFVYVTDSLSAGSKVRTFVLPNSAEAVAFYPIAVVAASKAATVAREFVDYVLGPAGQAELKAAGFGPPPPQG